MSARTDAKVQSDRRGAAPRALRRKASGAKGPARDRRSEIVEVAAGLFAEFGFEATSVRHIADEVNILAGSLYHHFATKEEILHEALKANLAGMVQDNQRLAHLPVDAELRLVANMIMRIRQYVDNWQFHAILLQEGKFFRRHNDFAYVVEAKGQAFAAQDAIMREGMEAGLFRPGIDTYMMIGTISRMLSSAAAWFRSGDVFSTDRPTNYTLDFVIDFHLDGVLRMIRTPARLEAPIPRALCERLLQGESECLS